MQETETKETKPLIYLDNSATTVLCDEARAWMAEAMDAYGNPSSLHTAGLAAHALLEKSRAALAQALGIRRPVPGQLLFTACGTEANNTALLGGIYSKKRRTANRVITTDSEHPSVARVMDFLEKRGFDVVRLHTAGGVIDLDEAQTAMQEATPLAVSVMLVNNETGARYDVESLFAMAKRYNPDAITHCDAVQGLYKCHFSPERLHADFVSVSAHKIHGPKGVGALYVSPEILRARRLVPYLMGGGQESGFRSGTENMIGIAGFAGALKAGLSTLDADIGTMEDLRTYAAERLEAIGLHCNLPRGAHAPHILSVTLPSIRSETMLHALSGEGICVSAGSACSARSNKTSGTLLAFGLTPEQADSTLRISFCAQNTRAQVDALVDALAAGINRLVRRTH